MSRATSGKPFLTRGSSSSIANGVNVGDVPIWNGSAWSTQDVRSSQGPEAWGLTEWNFPIMSQGGQTILISGQKYVLKLVPRVSRTITNIEIFVGAAGVTLTAGQNLMAFYNSAGVKLGTDSADQTTPWQSVGRKPIAIGGGPQAVVAGSVYYVELLSVGTTPPTLVRAGSAPNGVNFGASAAAFWFATNGGGATATDASITPSALSQTNNISIWIGTS